MNGTTGTYIRLPLPGTTSSKCHQSKICSSQLWWIWQLIEHFTASTTADIEDTEILNFLTDFKLDKYSWKLSTSKFITYWIQKFRWYDEYTFKVACGDNFLPVAFPDYLKIILLKSAVFHIPDLRSVALTQTQIYTRLVSTTSFDKYLAPLRSAAIKHEQAWQTNPHATLKYAVSTCIINFLTQRELPACILSSTRFSILKWANPMRKMWILSWL